MTLSDTQVTFLPNPRSFLPFFTRCNQAFLESGSVSFLPHSPLGCLRDLLHWVGSTQLRSVATWVWACDAPAVALTGPPR